MIPSRSAALRRPALAAVLVAFTIGAAGCSNNNSSSSTTPSPTITTETFTGTVGVRGSDMHTFSVTTSGEVDVTLTSTSPVANIVMGLAVGTPNNNVCTPLAGSPVDTAAGTGPQVMGRVTPGSFCVLVSDIGNATAPVTYTVTVAHP